MTELKAILSLAGKVEPGCLAGVDGLSQRLSNMRQFVQQQINTLTAKQVHLKPCSASLYVMPCMHAYIA